MHRELFMLFLVLASVLGGVMGACLWSLRGRDDGDGTAQGRRLDTGMLRRASAGDEAPSGIASNDGVRTETSTAAAWQPEPVDRHAEAQSRRIVSLVAELQAAEEQQMRLQRDLATLRASRQHGGETVHPRLLDGEDDLPVLNRRVSSAAGEAQVQGNHLQNPSHRSGSGSELLGLSLALDSTAEIPVMSEEELADSIDELELEFIGVGNRVDPHG